MRNPIQFLLRFRYLFLFLTLQVIAFSMLFRTQGHQRSVFMAATGDLVGAIQEQRDDVRSYLHLREANEALHAEIVDLQTQLQSTHIPSTDTLHFFEDSVQRQKYMYTAARVVNLRTNTRSNLITLDRGSAHGVNTDMGVVQGHSVVGLVKDVSENYAIVLPVINTQFGMSVRLLGSGVVGHLQWNGQDAQTATVRDIPRHVRPELGDTLVTTAFSNYFPENMLVATVRDVQERSDANFLDLTVDLTTNFNALEFVEVVENMLAPERKALEERNQENP